MPTFGSKKQGYELQNLNRRNSQIMPSCNLSQFSTLLFLFSILAFIIVSPRKTEAKDLLLNCTGNGTSAANNTYQFNLKTLLHSLSSVAATNSATEFYNTRVGSTNTKDTVYGLYMCSGDFNPQVCRECVLNSTKKIASLCPLSEVALIWDENCLVKYSNQLFFSTMDEYPTCCIHNKENYSGSQFYRVLRSLMKDLLNQASNAPMGSKKFSVERKTVSGETLLFGLAQCTPDLSSNSCRQCLEHAMADLQDSCAKGKIGGRMLYPSCMVRYEPYIFYNASLLATGDGKVPPAKGKKPSLEFIIAVVATSLLVVIFSFGCCFFCRKARRNRKDSKENFGEEINSELKSLQFDLSTIEAATNKFSDQNKIGEGGFGAVYKGMLFNGQEIAVKRLSKSSKQGISEFKNEVLLIAKLQHRNLVRLLGFCMKGEEKLLIYEFVHNKSLDYYLYNLQNQRHLTWSERYKIIQEIAKGILYLHEDSYLKVIHRDLKPSNILLDDKMNPKISDFGLARIVAMDQKQGETRKIAGTYGYMSPEYAMHGNFSVKSDVFSFGVIVLEIVSGRRNAYFNELDSIDDDLLTYAWKKWRDEKPLELLDPTLQETFSESEAEVIRCIQVGLLCVQENPDERPTTRMISLYFSSFSMDLPSPNEPAFFMHGKTKSRMSKESNSDQSLKYSIALSVSQIPMTESFP